MPSLPERLNFRWLCAILYVLGVLLFSIQPLRSLRHPAYQGLLPYRGSDESHYLVRLQESLSQPFADASNGIFSGMPAPPGVQPAFLEQVVGTLFSVTGLTAPAVALLMSVFVAPLTLLFTVFLGRRLGASPLQALLYALIYFFLFLGPLRRVVHQSWSLSLTMGTLLALTAWWQEPGRGRAALAGALLGLLPSVYFWSWTFLWATTFFLFLTSFFSGERRNMRLKGFAVLGVVMAVVSLPSIDRLLSLLQHPLAMEVAQRSSLVLTREMESVPRSIAFIFFVLCLLSSAQRVERSHGVMPIVCAALALLTVLHQQFLHGRVLSFWTHYYPYVCLVAILTMAAFTSRRGFYVMKGMTMLFASIFLIAAFFDYRGRAALLLPFEGRAWDFQHLAKVIPTLRDGRRDTILTDRETALVVASETDDDVVFTEHLRHVLISTEEYAERFCLSETFGEADPGWVPNILHELSNVGREERMRLYEERSEIAEKACIAVQENVEKALRRYGVTHVLWNEKTRPKWRIPHRLFFLQEQGEGWSLWQMTSPLNGASVQ